jgi:hypothetical protein
MNLPHDPDTKEMPKHILNWKTVRLKNLRGSDCNLPLPGVINLIYRGRLLGCILGMKKMAPISFDKAISLANEEWQCAFRADRHDQIDWLQENFVEWIAGQGYHIEITGDEFEPFWMSDKLA